MVERDGWQQPSHYSNVEEESRQLNEGAGVFDVSPAGKLLLQGNGLGEFLSRVLPANETVSVGDVRQVSLPATGRLAKLATDEYLALCPANELPKWVAALSEGLSGCVHLLDHTSGLAGLRLTGPKSDQLLCKLSELDTSPAAFPDLRCAQTKCAEIHGTLLRTDLGPLPSYDLYFPREFGEYLWDAIFEAGEEFGLTAVGFEAADRLQARLVTGAEK